LSDQKVGRLGEGILRRRTYQGWSMRAPRVGPLFVEDLDVLPDPVVPGQEARFRAKLRNDGGLYGLTFESRTVTK